MTALGQAETPGLAQRPPGYFGRTRTDGAHHSRERCTRRGDSVYYSRPARTHFGAPRQQSASDRIESSSRRLRVQTPPVKRYLPV